MPDRSDRPTPADDTLRDELVRTRRDLVRVREELARVERERDRLRRENERLKDDLEAPLPPGCPHCGGTVRETRVADQYQEDLPPVRPVVRRFRVHIGHCTQCPVGSKAVIRGKRPTPSARRPSNWARTRSPSP